MPPRLFSRNQIRRNCRFKHLVVCVALGVVLMLLLSILRREAPSYRDLRFFSYPPDVDLDVIIERSQLRLTPVYPPQPNLQPSNARNFPFVLGDLEACHRERVQFVLLVKSTHAAAPKRQAIRATWANRSCFGAARVRIFFLLGRSALQREEQAVRSEQAAFGDLLAQPFRDRYYNNTLKLMMGFEFFVRFCPQAEFLVLLDDDYLVSPSSLTAYMAGVHRRLLPRFLAGHVWYNAKPKREPSSKWFVSPKRYPFDSFPPYAEAGTLIVSAPLARDLYVAMQYTAYHPFDDVFLGFVLHKMHIAPVHSQRIQHLRPRKLRKDFISCHGYDSSAELLKAWRREGLQARCELDAARVRARKPG